MHETNSDVKELNKVVVTHEEVKVIVNAMGGMSIAENTMEFKGYGEANLDKDDSKHDDEEVYK
jgi:hypothetical protein